MMFSQQRIQDRVAQLAKDIGHHHVTHAVVVLTGALHFASDLLRALEMDLPVSFMIVRSYGGTSQIKYPEVIYGPRAEEIHGQHILLIEDIVDTGNTLRVVEEYLDDHGASSITIVSLLLRATCFRADVINYVGFVLEDDEFVVGYGLDIDGRGRHTYGIDSV